MAQTVCVWAYGFGNTELMKQGQKRSALSYIPGYTNNTVLQVIIFSTVCYVLLGLTWAVIRIVYPDDSNFYNYFLPLVGLPALAQIKTHIWTLLTYGWFLAPGRFWELVTNMIWVYCFGSVVQFLVGHKQVIPLYIYGLVTGGVFYLLGLLIPGIASPANTVQLGPGAGVITLAVASVTLAPGYRLYFTEYFSLPLAAVAGVFGVLILISTGLYLPALFLYSGGAVSGFVYIKALQAGYRPGAWMYDLVNRVEGVVTPGGYRGRKNPKTRRTIPLDNTAGTRKSNPEQRIDDLLDKINQKGLGSLTQEERDFLKSAGK